MVHIHIFLSAVSAEFGNYRDALRRKLDRQNVTVKIQEQLIPAGTETLALLDDYIRQCDAVVHMVGDMSGAHAMAPSVAAIRSRYPDFANRCPPTAPFLEPDGPSLSYTQWEGWLALYHRKCLIIATPAKNAPRDPSFAPDEVSRVAQREHLRRLAAIERFPGIRDFANADQLIAEAFRGPLLDILAAAERAPSSAELAAGLNDLATRFGLVAAPTGFRNLVERFVKLYVGTEKAPVPFGGRSAEIEALNSWLEGRAERNDPLLLEGDSDSTNMLITAPAGRGKTALLIRWIEQLKGDWSLVFVPVSIRAKTNEVLTFYQALAAQLAAILGEPLPQPGADPAAYYRDKVVDYLDRVGKGRERCLVIVDGLDEARGWEMDTSVLPNQSSPNLKIVISARELAGDDGPPDWQRRLGWSAPQGSAQTLRVLPLTREGVADVLAKMDFPVQQLSKEVDVVDELYRLSDNGDPLVLHFYANDLLRRGESAARLRPTELRRLQPGFGAYISQWLRDQREEWKKTGERIDEEFVDAILAVLAGAHGPLKLAELEELVGRVLPGHRIFSVRMIEPLRRFIIGDGAHEGYALAHPKLADVLNTQYFAGAKILRATQGSFLSWLSGVVDALNDGSMDPGEAPTYALLFYTQHLAAASSDAVLPAYRALLEHGWLRAWEKHEGGFQGFSRDVESAVMAFRTAGDRDARLLQRPNIGFGAVVRCALFLSSVKSVGYGVPGEVLSELLRGDKISAGRALYLALLKPEDRRKDAVTALIEELPADLRLQAYAASSDIVSPAVQFDYLLAVAPFLPDRQKAKAVRRAAQAVSLIKEGWRRRPAVDALKPHLTHDEWSALNASERERTAAEVAAAQSQMATTTEPTSIEDTQTEVQLVRLAERADLTQDQIAEILLAIKDWRRYQALLVVTATAARLDRQRQILALDLIERSGTLWQSEMLAELARYVDADLLDEIVRIAVTVASHNLKSAIDAVLARTDAPDTQLVLRRVREMPDSYYRKQALEALVPALSPALVADTVRWALSLSGFYAGEYLTLLLPRLPIDELLDLARQSEADIRGVALIALASKAPAEVLPEALELTRRIVDQEDRGRVLAKLLPRLRSAGLLDLFADVYQTTFAIGDSGFRSFAGAALEPYSVRKRPAPTSDELARELSKVVQIQDSAAFVHILSVILRATSMSIVEANGTMEHCIAAARTLKDPSARATALGILASRLDRARGRQIMAEAVDLARNSPDGAAVGLAMLALFQAPNDMPMALEDARREAEISTDEDERRIALAFVRIGMLIISDASAGAAPTEFLDRNTANENDDIGFMTRLMFVMALLLTRQPSSEDAAVLVRRIEDALLRMPDPAVEAVARSLMTVYLPTRELWPQLRRVLEIGARLSRPVLLMVLALSQGIIEEAFKQNPNVGASRLAGSPFTRLGGADTVDEVLDSIETACSWWP